MLLCLLWRRRHQPSFRRSVGTNVTDSLWAVDGGGGASAFLATAVKLFIRVLVVDLGGGRGFAEENFGQLTKILVFILKFRIEFMFTLDYLNSFQNKLNSYRNGLYH